MTLAARRRSIRKHVTQMAAAARAHLFHADHSIAAVAHAPDMRFIVGREETRPTCARVELGARAKQRQAAKAARVDALLVVVEEHAAERRFGAVLEQHASLVRAETGRDLRTLRGTRRPQVKTSHRASSRT